MTVQVVGPDTDETASSADELERLLDRVEHQLQTPTLIEMKTPDATLNIGLGHPTAAVALYLDRNGQPWAIHQPNTSTATDISFTKNGVPYQFYPTAVITPRTARQAAHEFLRTGERPLDLDWRTEPT